MESLLYISALIAALAFFILVIYLAMVLVSTKRTLDNVAVTLESLEKQTRGITRETEELLIKTNQLAEDVKQKSSSLNGLFDGVKGIGETVKDFNNAFRNVSEGISEQALKYKDETAQAVRWTAALRSVFKRK